MLIQNHNLMSVIQLGKLFFTTFETSLPVFMTPCLSATKRDTTPYRRFLRRRFLRISLAWQFSLRLEKTIFIVRISNSDCVVFIQVLEDM